MVINDEGKYSWIYEFDMEKNRSIFNLVLKVVLGIYAFVAAFLLGLDLFNGSSPLWSLKILGIVLAVLLPIVFLCYKYVQKKYNNNYIMLYEMDEEGIRFSQIEDQQQITELIGFFTAMAGVVSGNYGLTGSYLTARDNTAHSEFAKVTRITTDRNSDLISLDSPFLHNMIYVRKEDYDEVLNYIRERCPKAQ